MNANISKVTTKGQVVIPKKLRKKYAIAPATAIRWIAKEDGIMLVPEPGDSIKAARGMLKGSGMLKAFMRDKQLEKEREKKRLDRVK